MEVAASVATELAFSGLSRVINKLASNFGGDVTPYEMDHLNVFVAYEIEALIREAKYDDLVKSNPLLEKLQAAALELEDLLDLFEYNQIEKQVSSSSSNPIKKFICKSKEKLEPILPKSSLRIGVEKLLKFVEQVEKKHPFIMSRKGTTQPPAYNVTPKTSTPSSPFYGRGDQCDMIVKLLLDESHADLNSRTKNVPIIAIRGLGGAGKTTTAQHVYNKNKIENYFDLRMWVQVTRGFDERRLITEIIESAEKNACSQISNLDVLQTKLKDSVSKKKFLLVLDDVWKEDTTRLYILLSPLNQVGVKGSRIIVTTQTEKAAKDLNAKPIILLDELKDDDCWSILKHYAFDDNEEIIEDHQELKYVGNKIISMVKHSPLALKVVGSSLRNKRSANEWEKILQQEDILKKDIMDLLLFSYQCMPLHLQRCFAYCSLFPKSYKFTIDVHSHKPHLISLWIAHGFIENTSEPTLEEAGKKYIEELLSYSFFEKYGSFDNYFVIHDLLHELAEKVSKKQYYRIEHYDSLHVPKTCIHLSFYITNNLVDVDMSHIVAISDIFKLRNLRSLIILKHDGSTNIFKSRKDISQNLTKLRALYVDEDQQMEVLNDPHIDNLKHLRYLHVRCDSRLPTSLTKLYQLQFFILTTWKLGDGSKNLLANTLPQGFGNLFNLHILKFYNQFNGVELDYLHYNSEMINIKKLTSLQNLKKFYVDVFNGMIALRNLPIGGSLSILNLENVKCKKEAEEAMLNKKKNLNELTFKWNNKRSSIDICEEVLEGLEPHRNLEKLCIEGYQGVRFSNWMMKENWLPRLQALRLVSCTNIDLKGCGTLSNLEKLSSLIDLYIADCPAIESLPNLPLSLRSITISRSPKFDLKGCGALSNLEKLSSLYITDCPAIESLQNLPLSLQSITISACPKFDLKGCGALSNLEKLSSLHELEIVDCPATESLPNLSLSLQAITIIACPKFDLKGCGALSNLEKLSSLYIKKCPAIESLPNLPLSLQNFVIWGCPKFDLKGCGALSNLEKLSFLGIGNCYAIESLSNLPLSLPNFAIWGCPKFDLKGCGALSNLEKLSSLYITDCPAIESLPNLPLSLESLHIRECPKLKLKYEEGGPFRNTISHIPKIYID